MTNFHASSGRQAGQTIILSVRPKYAELILSGAKTVEFRRVWAVQDIRSIAIYASAPVQRILGVVSVSMVVPAKTSTLWTLCAQRGGGLSRTELLDYFEGKQIGYAVLLGKVRRFRNGIEPRKIIKNFSPPQSFRYMSPGEVTKLAETADAKKP
jgi:predicted transcriptional regulator